VLGDPNNPKHAAYMLEHKIDEISLVAVNLYAFEEVAAKVTSQSDLTAIEKIDIGGPTLIRSAAKNFNSVIVLAEPADYNWVTEELQETGDVSMKSRLLLATTVFDVMRKYEEAIFQHLRTRVIG
jgi:phosphoribosylaminoimidazolecarboxamide formyltransferase / IMP cyclohydrolase